MAAGTESAARSKALGARGGGGPTGAAHGSGTGVLGGQVVLRWFHLRFHMISPAQLGDDVVRPGDPGRSC